MTSIKFVSSPVGRLLLIAKQGALVGLWIEGCKRYPDIETNWQEKDEPVLIKAEHTLSQYFAGKGLGSMTDIQFKLLGTPFQVEVWREIAKIGPGQTLAYSQLAERVGLPKAVRAVASAVAKNPISILIGCHRITGHDGTVGQFAAGPQKKKMLLKIDSNQV